MLKISTAEAKRLGLSHVKKYADATDKVVAVELTGDLKSIFENIQKIKAEMEAKGYQNTEGFVLSGEFGIYATPQD